MTTEKSQKITIEIQARITIDGIEPNLPFLSTLANAVMDNKQTVIDATPQKPKELLPQQQPVTMPQNNEQRYGDKTKKQVSPSQIRYINQFAEEGKFKIQEICEKYGVSDISQLNMAQAQEIFDANKKIKNGYRQNNG